jgi:hypothetical protein
MNTSRITRDFADRFADERIAAWNARDLPLLGFLGFALYTACFVAPLGPNASGPGVNIVGPPKHAASSDEPSGDSADARCA